MAQLFLAILNLQKRHYTTISDRLLNRVTWSTKELRPGPRAGTKGFWKRVPAVYILSLHASRMGHNGKGSRPGKADVQLVRGTKTWGEWANPDPSRFLQVRSHRSHLNTAFWQLKATCRELKTVPILKTQTLSSICSGKHIDPGHRKRVDFLKFLEAKDDEVVHVDVWAYDNPLGFRNWVGPHPPGVKDAALAPYKYFFAAENNQEWNFITEKLWEPLLTESLCFYWGCPNATDWVDSRAFISLDLDNFEEAFRTMKTAILSNEWEKRLDFIQSERQQVLDCYQFFPTLEQVLRNVSGRGASDAAGLPSLFWQ